MEDIKQKINDLFEYNVDGIDFTTKDVYGFNFDKSNKFKEFELGFKYNIITYKFNNGKYYDIDSYSTILGDPKYFLINHINAGYNGIIMKKCLDSDKILLETINKFLLDT